MPFLTAHWKNLCLITFAVPPKVLEARLPHGLTLDTRAGAAFVSLVAFDFLDTRVLGVPWPGYRNFPEINLRFYVRRGAERGVVFVREFVPKRLIASLARALYNEPYLAIPMTSRTTCADGHVTVEHHFELGGSNSIRIVARDATRVPADDSVEHFFKEHRWGFGRDRSGRTLRYEVQHPTWEIYREPRVECDLDFAGVYGEEFGFLNGATPHSVVLAKGSRIVVNRKTML